MRERSPDDRHDAGEYTDADPGRQAHSDEDGDYTDVEREDGTVSRGDDGIDGEYTDADHAGHDRP